jgi:hypothetical protein
MVDRPLSQGSSDGASARRGRVQEMGDEPHTQRRGWLKNGNPPGDLSTARRCGAKTRRATACQGPARRKGRCRMHGGSSTGPRTAAGLKRNRRARWRHGAVFGGNPSDSRRITSTDASGPRAAEPRIAATDVCAPRPGGRSCVPEQMEAGRSAGLRASQGAAAIGGCPLGGQHAKSSERCASTKTDLP